MNTHLKTINCLLLVLTIYLFGCSPLIHSFTVNTQNIGTNDSVKLNWSVKGIPTLLVHIQELGSTNKDSILRRQEYTLVVQKNGKEKTKFIQVDVRKVINYTDIIINVQRKKDSLYAQVNSDIQKWRYFFVIDQVSNPSTRDLQVIHDNKTVNLRQGMQTAGFNGSFVFGNWQIISSCTEQEKKDTSLIPQRFKLRLRLKHI